RRSGAPIYNAIVWQDRRTARQCHQLIEQGLAPLIKEKTGLVIDPYFSATKLRWILDHVAGARAKAEAGQLAFGTVDSWLVWNLTGGRDHITDVTNASRTMLADLSLGSWDQDLLKLFSIPASLLPDIRPSSQVYGYTSTQLLGTPLPIAGLAGDQHAALFGQNCTQPGMVKNTYGTGCFMLMCTGARTIASQHGLLTTLACQSANQISYALEGSVFMAGATVQWLRDAMHLIGTAAEVEQLAAQVPSSEGTYLVPAFAGLGAPHWDPHARGLIVGMTRGTTSAHLARATLDSIAHQTADVLEAMEFDSGLKITEVRVDGGAAANNLLLQIQADLLGATVLRPKVTETTSLGAAYLAGLATGFWSGPEEISALWELDHKFTPQLDSAETQRLRRQWQRAVELAKSWHELE
ncbi:MAG: FGGY family carbohydrate kinase, partial [Dehalococcoidia bacterium]